MISLSQLYADRAREWVGVVYQHRGTTRRGCDCTGLLVGIAQELGLLKNYKLRSYSFDWNLHAGAGNYIVEELKRYSNEIPKSETRVGDILIFRFGKCLAHAGILVAKGLFVHSIAKAKVCKYSVLKNSIWSTRWAKTFRLDERKMVQRV